MEGFMKLALLFVLLASFSAFAQTDSATTAPAQDSMGAPVGEATMAQEAKPMKKHKKIRHAKRKHHKKEKAHRM